MLMRKTYGMEGNQIERERERERGREGEGGGEGGRERDCRLLPSVF